MPKPCPAKWAAANWEKCDFGMANNVGQFLWANAFLYEYSVLAQVLSQSYCIDSLKLILSENQVAVIKTNSRVRAEQNAVGQKRLELSEVLSMWQYKAACQQSY